MNERGIHIHTHGLVGRIYEVRRWDELRCRDIHTEFHKDWFRHSKVDSGLHTLMGGIYEVRRWDELKCHDIHTEFHKDWFMYSKVGRGYTDTQTDGRDL
jgi:hypothetical protein